MIAKKLIGKKIKVKKDRSDDYYSSLVPEMIDSPR